LTGGETDSDSAFEAHEIIEKAKSAIVIKR
jgi:hypothetical protein